MKPVSASTLRLLAPYLIDIHGQNDGQKLLDEAHHIDYLDGYAGNAALLERCFAFGLTGTPVRMVVRERGDKE